MINQPTATSGGVEIAKYNTCLGMSKCRLCTSDRDTVYYNTSGRQLSNSQSASRFSNLLKKVIIKGCISVLI